MKRSRGAIGLFLAVTGILFCGCSDKAEQSHFPSALADRAINLNAKNAKVVIDPLFQGEYISPEPEKIDKGIYYTDLVISRQEEKDSVKVVFSSAKIKKQVCCSFSRQGFIKNDTLFVPLPPSHASAMMVITHNSQKGIGNSINVSMQDTSQNALLMEYCCPGASLAGQYTPCDLSQFRTDTTMANQDANNPIP